MRRTRFCPVLAGSIFIIVCLLAESAFAQQQHPRLSSFAVEETVNEGEVITMTATLDAPAPQGGSLIPVTIAEQLKSGAAVSPMFIKSHPDGTVTTDILIRVGETTGSIEIPIEVNGWRDTTTVIDFTIAAGSGTNVRITEDIEDTTYVLDADEVTVGFRTPEGPVHEADGYVDVYVDLLDGLFVNYDYSLVILANDGSATRLNDFTAPGTVDIKAGETSSHFRVRIVDSNQLEPDERFTISLFRNGLTDQIKVSDAHNIITITIIDDDTAQLHLKGMRSAYYAPGESIALTPALVPKYGDCNVPERIHYKVHVSGDTDVLQSGQETARAGNLPPCNPEFGDPLTFAIKPAAELQPGLYTLTYTMEKILETEANYVTDNTDNDTTAAEASEMYVKEYLHVVNRISLAGEWTVQVCVPGAGVDCTEAAYRRNMDAPDAALACADTRYGNNPPSPGVSYVPEDLGILTSAGTCAVGDRLEAGESQCRMTCGPDPAQWCVPPGGESVLPWPRPIYEIQSAECTAGGKPGNILWKKIGLTSDVPQSPATQSPPSSTQTASSGGGGSSTSLGGNGGGGGGSTSRDVHGDTAAQATPIPVTPRMSTTAGQLNSADDVDYFTVNAPQAGVLVVETTGSTDTVGTVWQDGAELGTADNSGEGRNFRLSVRVEAGPVVIAVTGTGRQTGAYTLQTKLLVGYLENPGVASFQSGIGVIAGWVCEADEVAIEIGHLGRQVAAYGTERLDTAAECGDQDNGFGLLFNWNLLGDGMQTVVALADGVAFAQATFTVTTLGEEFVTDAAGETVLADFPTAGETVRLVWQEAHQNFVLAPLERRPPPASPPSPAGGPTGVLENPGPASFQSGLGLVSGWVCDAEVVELEINGGARIAAAYGTARADTAAVCGDADNGFGLLFNWNLLGDGTHTVVALADGEEFGRATFTVTTLGAEFVQGARGETVVTDFPSPGEDVHLIWQEATQNFVLAPLP